MYMKSWDRCRWRSENWYCRGYINHVRYASDTILLAESINYVKWLLMNIKEKSEKMRLQLNIKKTKIIIHRRINADDKVTKMQGTFKLQWLPSHTHHFNNQSNTSCYHLSAAVTNFQGYCGQCCQLVYWCHKVGQQEKEVGRYMREDSRTGTEVSRSSRTKEAREKGWEEKTA